MCYTFDIYSAEHKVRNNWLSFMVMSALTDISVQEESCLAENTGKEGEIG